MPKFKEGDLVKKVRGRANIGIVGVVVDANYISPITYSDILVQVLDPATIFPAEKRYPPGTTAATKAKYWELLPPPEDEEEIETEREEVLIDGR